MREERRKCVVIASVLKPVDDTRMFEKIGLTLASNGHDVHVIGVGEAQSNAVKIHSLGKFSRLSLRRLAAPFIVLRKVIAIKPHFFIITTHELLWVSLMAKILTGCKVVYDVQENYYRNILHTKVFAGIARPLIAGYVRLKEKLSSPFIEHFILAEKSYERELSFLRNRFTIVENKVKRLHADIRKQSRGKNRLLFSGTLAESTGVFIAIDVAKALHEIDSTIELTIIGFASQQETLNKIREVIRDFPFMHLTGGSELVPHEVIMQSIMNADLGFICYPPNPSTSGSTPTKLYEYLGYQLPILLLNHHEHWRELCERYSAAVLFDYPLHDPILLLDEMKNRPFYATLPGDVFWESEEAKLLSVFLL
jgi:hypothetical protein